MEQFWSSFSTYDIMSCTLPGGLLLGNALFWVYITPILSKISKISTDYILIELMKDIFKLIKRMDLTLVIAAFIFASYFLGTALAGLASVLREKKERKNGVLFTMQDLKECGRLHHLHKLSINDKREKRIIQFLLKTDSDYSYLSRLMETKRFLRNTIMVFKLNALASLFFLVLYLNVGMLMRFNLMIIFYVAFSLVLSLILNKKCKIVADAYENHLLVFWYDKKRKLTKEYMK